MSLAMRHCADLKTYNTADSQLKYNIKLYFANILPSTVQQKANRHFIFRLNIFRQTTHPTREVLDLQKIDRYILYLNTGDTKLLTCDATVFVKRLKQLSARCGFAGKYQKYNQICDL